MTALTVPDPILPTAEWQLVDPQTARDWLRKNKNNRPVRQSKVEALARDMASGDWLQTGEPIKFNDLGDLADGQHRLHAVVAADTPVLLFVVRGIPAEAMAVMDTGARRTAADMLTLAGYSYAAILGAAARLGIAWNEGGFVHANQSQPRSVTHSEVRDFVAEHPAMAHHASEASTWCRTIPARSAVVCFTRWLTAQKQGAQSNLFFTNLAELRLNGPGDPLYTLHRRLTNARDNKESISRVTESYFVIRTWNAFRNGESLSSLTATSRLGAVKFPEVA